MATPKRLTETEAKLVLQKRLEKCWNLDLDWTLYPAFLQQGLCQLGKSYDVPPSTVLSGLLLVESYCLSHCSISVPDVEWIEPSLLWIAICMPASSGKSPFHNFLTNLLDRVRSRTLPADSDAIWMVDDSSFEKMGAMMAKNGNRLLGLYDEFSTFLTQVKGKGISESHDLSTFLSLYNGKSWNRDTVSGDANFHMKKTGLTVGGFTQPSVAKSLLESPQAIERGLVQRFLWIFPKPTYSKFAKLQRTNQSFVEYLTSKLVMVNSKQNRQMSLAEDEKTFQNKFDQLQGDIELVSVCDELIAGMLGKAKGQILRVAACLQIFFDDSSTIHEKLDEETEQIIDMEIEQVEELPTIINADAIAAAINFVEVCCQHTLYITGRQLIADEVNKYKNTEESVMDLIDQPDGSEIPIEKTIETAAFCLLLPGATLDLSSLLAAKRFRYKNGKKGALLAMKLLQRENLGELLSKKATRGTSSVYTFKKLPIPTESGLEELSTKLSKFNISIREYAQSLQEGSHQSSRIDPPCSSADHSSKRRRIEEQVEDEE